METFEALLQFRDGVQIDPGLVNHLLTLEYITLEGLTELGKEMLSAHLLEIGRTGLLIHNQGKVTYDDWSRAGVRLWRTKSAVCWALGDWINFGESCYGEKYAQALAETDYDYGTLRNYASTCNQWPFPSRRADISFAHHVVVSKLPMQERLLWLDRAVSEHLNRDELREAVFGKPIPIKTVLDIKSTGLQVVDILMALNLSAETIYHIMVKEASGKEKGSQTT